jgi:hypothetical protein
VIAEQPVNPSINPPMKKNNPLANQATKQPRNQAIKLSNQVINEARTELTKHGSDQIRQVTDQTTKRPISMKQLSSPAVEHYGQSSIQPINQSTEQSVN